MPHLLALALAAAFLAVAQSTAAQTTVPSSPTEQETPAAEPPEKPAAEAPAQPEPRRRKLYPWGSIGTTFAYGETYASANLGVGYLMRGGITPNVEGSYMFGNSPTLLALRPGVTWFMPGPGARPYIGAYYTHWFVGDDRPDQDGVGGRVGFSLGRVLSLGVTYDRALGCSNNCDVWTPQISAGLSL